MIVSCGSKSKPAESRGGCGVGGCTIGRYLNTTKHGEEHTFCSVVYLYMIFIKTV